MIADDQAAQLTVRSKPRLCFTRSAPRSDAASLPLPMDGQIMTSRALHGMKRDGQSEHGQETTAEKLSVVVGCCGMPGFTPCAKPRPINLPRSLVYAGCVIVPWAMLCAACALLAR